MTRAEQAAENFLSGCNCAQSVLLAFSDETGLDDATAMRIASGFGGGMARMREVCGAVSGMFMAAGLIFGSDDVSHEKRRRSICVCRRWLRSSGRKTGACFAASCSRA